jgi:hypothetical protein
VSTDFVIVPREDPALRLLASFPELWNELLEQADPDEPYLLYFCFADLLLQRRSDTELWKRAYRFLRRHSGERG